MAQTSLILALLLPHILYIITISTFKYLTPSLVQYLATSTIAADLISFYIPLWKTLIVVLKYKHVCDIGQRDKPTTITDTDTTTHARVDESESESMKKSTGYFSFLYKSTLRPTGTVADEYKKAITNKKSNNNSNKGGGGPIPTKKSSSQKHTQTKEFNVNEINATSKEATELLKYWIVYGIITSFIHIATLLPILGRIFYNANPINAKKAATSISKWRTTKKNISLLDKIKIPTSVLEEIKLFFFSWLRLLPTSLTLLSFNNNNTTNSNNSSTTITNTATNNTGSVKNRIKAMEKQSTTTTSSRRRSSSKTTNTYNSFSNQPLDIMYEKLSPIVTSTNAILVRSSNNNNNYNNNTTISNPLDSFKAKVILFSQTMLNAMVWTKIISESTKELIENTFSQCRQLLPAALTLTMPSYFTTYGVIYVQFIVPHANSTTTYNEFYCQYNNRHEVLSIIDKDGCINEKWISISLRIIHYLQYWTIQAILSSILISFAPVLAWIPLSTHLIWLLWAYVQLESKTKRLYNIMEFDLLAFGILKTDRTLFVSCDEEGRGKKMDHNSGNDSASVIKDTVTMQFLNSIMETVPSNLSKGTCMPTDNSNTRDDKKD